MEVMTHSSAFLLPHSSSAVEGPALTYALVVLNRTLPRFTPILWEHAQLHLCADGGANRLYDELPLLFPEEDDLAVRKRIFLYALFGYMDLSCGFQINNSNPLYLFGKIRRVVDFKSTRFRPDVIKGDLDSIREDVLEFYKNVGSEVIDASHDQDTADLHKCIAYIQDLPNLKHQNVCILAAGALGGRFDHEIGNINVLCSFSNMRIVLLSDDCIIQLLPSGHRHELHIQSAVEGPHCGLIPICGPSKRTTTTGLEWNLRDTEMRFGGLISTSNVVKEEIVTVESDSDLLWTISIKKA